MTGNPFVEDRKWSLTLTRCQWRLQGGANAAIATIYPSTQKWQNMSKSIQFSMQPPLSLIPMGTCVHFHQIHLHNSWWNHSIQNSAHILHYHRSAEWQSHMTLDLKHSNQSIIRASQRNNNVIKVTLEVTNLNQHLGGKIKNYFSAQTAILAFERKIRKIHYWASFLSIGSAEVSIYII